MNFLLFLFQLGRGLRTPYTLPRKTGTQKTGLAFMNIPLPLGTGIRLFSLFAFLTLSSLSSRFEICGVDDDEALIGCNDIKRS